MKFEKLVIKLLLYIANCVLFDNYGRHSAKEFTEIQKECKEFLGA